MRLVSITSVLFLTLVSSPLVCPSQQIYFPNDGVKHYSDKCEVALVDWKTSRVTVLGSFKFLRNESDFGMGSFHLPGTKNYIVGKAGVDDETLQSHTEHYSVTMDIVISRTRKFDVSRSLNWARGEMLANSEMGRVALSTQLYGRLTIVDMVCTSLDLRKPK